MFPGGLGTATGNLLRRNGARLAVLYAPFEKSRREQVLSESYGSPPKTEVNAYECDITSPSSVDAAFASIAKDVGKDEAQPRPFPSIMINAAGYVCVMPMEDHPSDEILKNLHANIYGPMLCSQAFAKLYWSRASQHSDPALSASTTTSDAGDVPHNTEQASASRTKVKHPPGRIVSISSQAAHVALWGHGAYCASKAGLMGLTRSMASEWGSRGITANTVSPTVAWTTLGKKAWAEQDRREAFMKTIPVGRFAEPQDIAEAIVWLCKDEQGMVNGGDIKVDGGFTTQ